MRRVAFLVACLMAVFVVRFAATYRTGVASGVDSYGYVSAVELWRNGNLHISQPFARQLPWPEANAKAAPLGYKPAARSEDDEIVPVYSAGLPLIMTAFSAVGGYKAIFWVVPIFAGLFVIATFGIGQHIGGSLVGLGAAALTALSPVMLFMSLWPMTDVPVAASWALATWAVLGSSRSRAVGGGLLAGMALLIRPNLVFVGAAMGLWVLLRDLRRGTPHRIDRTIAFALAAAPGLIAVLAINRALYGSPFVSGYGTLGSVLHLANLVPNLQRYTSWFAESQTRVAFLGVIPLALPVTFMWRDRARAMDAALLTMLALGTLACFLFFMPLDEWWYLRFLMPMWPGVFVGVAWLFVGHRPWWRVMLGIAVIYFMGRASVDYAESRRITAALEGERRFVRAAQLTRDHTEPNSVIFSMEHSGSVRFYGERMTMRFDLFFKHPEWLDPGVQFLMDHGAHPYLLLDEWEIERWKRELGPLNARGRLDMKVVFELEWPTHMWLFDLAAPKTAEWEKINAWLLPRIGPTVEPGRPPSFVLR